MGGATGESVKGDHSIKAAMPRMLVGVIVATMLSVLFLPALYAPSSRARPLPNDTPHSSAALCGS